MRERRRKKKLGLNDIAMELQDVFINPEKKEIIFPNRVANIETRGKGGVKIDES